MIVRRSKKAIPRCFGSHPAGHYIVAEADIHVRGRRGMQAKVVVCKNKTGLRRFWKEAMGRDLGAGCNGVVTPLATQHVDGGFVEVDPNYFCLIGLQLNGLSMEIITHESIHAGFAYAKRHAKDFWVLQGDDYNEEDVAYPAGRIASHINSFLHDKGLYK